MEIAEKLIELRIITEADDDDLVLLTYLDLAKGVILNRMYPYKDDEELEGMEVPKRFEQRQIEVAAYLLNKRGAEGETQHIENGIHRNYRSAHVPVDMLWDIAPQAGIPR